MQEIWKPIVGYENLYEVSNLGRVKSLSRKVPVYLKNVNLIVRKGKILKPINNSRGYLNIHLSKDKKRKTLTIHRLVAEAFIPNSNKLPYINHIDGNKHNNCVDNLEWCTQKENVNHAITTGLIKHRYHRIVGQYDLNGNFIKYWLSIKSAQQEYGRINISACCKGKQKTAGHYVWKYEKFEE